MTQTTVCDTEKTHFQATSAMQARFAEKLEEYLKVIAQMWRDNGEDADGPDGLAALESVRYTMSVPERDEWMRLDLAIAVMATSDQFTDSPARHLEGRDAMRTMWSVTEKDRVAKLAECMGLNAAYVKENYVPKSDARKEAIAKLEQTPTAIYRHYDIHGTLLYIGITSDFTNRDAMHEYKSRWWAYVADTKVVWLPNRREAMQAEEHAIKDEFPLFNVQYSRLYNVERLQEGYMALNMQPA